jgi:NADH-quinone oxidoreductase subunit J
MSFYSGIFYILAIVTGITTFMAITRRHALHAIVYLIISFIGTALLYYLLGAPFLALLEVIIYAGAIMVLFIFIIMMIQIRSSSQTWGAALKQWLPAIVLCGIAFSMASPREFGRFLFQQYWFPVEIASFLLLIALVGALYLGRGEEKSPAKQTEKAP